MTKTNYPFCSQASKTNAQESKIQIVSRKPNHSVINYNISYQLICLIVLLILSSSSFAVEKYCRVKIYLPQDITQRIDLLGLLEVDHFHEHEGAIETEISASQVKLLKQYNTKYQILSNDVAADLEKANATYFKSIKDGSTSRVAFEQSGSVVDKIIKTPAAFQVKTTLGGYYSFAEMNTAMDNLVAAYPNIAQKFSIGKTTQGRDMWCIKISDNVATDDTDEPEVLFMGLHHAREAIGGASMIFLMQYLCENYTTDINIKNLVDNREFFIVVCANPDGWEYNRSTNPNGGGQWRKNRSVNTGGSFGVDLNRNWGIDWANCTGAIGASSCGSATASSDVYWGKAAFSEPETVNLRNFVQSRKFVTVMDQHSVGPYYSLPFGRLTRSLTAIDNLVYTQMTSVMGKYNGMRYGSTYQTLGYEVSGGMKDWLLIGDTARIGKIYGMTGEGCNGSSSVTFWPLASEIIFLCKGMIYQDLQIALTAGSYVDFQDMGKLDVQSLIGNFKFNVRRIGLENKPVTVTLIPLQNITSVGAPITIASLPSFNTSKIDSIAYTLPSTLVAGQSIKFVWKIETGGYTYYDTVVNLYKPTVLFTDNMEGSTVTTKWTVSTGWAYTTDGAYSGTKSLAESPAANYTNSSTRTITSKTNLNLTTAKTAFISFWVKHRSENFRDKLQLQVSTNGTTWVEMAGRTTVQEPGTRDGSTINGKPSLTGINENWTREIFDISRYAGVAALRFRFVFTSGASSSYVYGVDKGFNIDDISIISSTLLPSASRTSNHPMSFVGQNSEDKNILNVDMPTETDVKQYIIERSVNGIDFEAFDIIKAISDNNNAKGYTVIDNHPYTGENLYRVKVEHTDGALKLSNLVSLEVKTKGNKPTGISTIYPNPTAGNMTINFVSTEEQATFLYSIYSISGQLMHDEMLRLQAGEHTISLDATSFAKGEYFITFRNPANGVNYESKFIKL